MCNFPHRPFQPFNQIIFNFIICSYDKILKSFCQNMSVFVVTRFQEPVLLTRFIKAMNKQMLNLIPQRSTWILDQHQHHKSAKGLSWCHLLIDWFKCVKWFLRICFYGGCWILDQQWLQDKIVFIISFYYSDIFMLLTKPLDKSFSWPRSLTPTTGSRFFIYNMACISPIAIFASFFPNISTPELDKPCPTINTWLARPTISVALVNMSIIALAERWKYTGN